MPNSVSIGFSTAMKRDRQDDSNDTPQPIREFQVDIPFLRHPLRLILVYPNPQYREADLKLTYRLWGIVWIVLMSLVSWQGQNLCLLSLAFIVDCRVVTTHGNLFMQYQTEVFLQVVFIICLRTILMGKSHTQALLVDNNTPVLWNSVLSLYRDVN